ncbi:RRXRR domain-containing protein [Scytonema sp. PCC 10023]|uniref:RRXRR domain-containing protein n=1 Tax=Scytonema sp. PCC 10023 TaxID=1680591 RepID=UPI0039C624F0
MRIPVVSKNGKPLMPTTPSRARRWLKEGKAIPGWSRLGVFYVQLTVEPSNTKTQPIVIGLDPGKLYSGIGVQSSKFTLLMLHLVLPFKTVKDRMEQRAMMRRGRRGRRINRKLSYSQRAHRQVRFDNRKQKKVPPSICANKTFELRALREIVKLYPVQDIIVERVMARGDKGFSPVMVGQLWLVGQIEEQFGIKPSTIQGWETSNLRKQLGLPKDKQDKSRQVPETHAVDGITIAASHWVKYGITSANSMGSKGQISITPSQFVIVKRPPVSRRQLHLMVPAKGGVRRRYGGTVTRHGFRKGDYVEATQGAKTYRGWVSGDTDKQVSVSDASWKRLGQFTVKKVRLIQRSTGLIVLSTKDFVKPSPALESRFDTAYPPQVASRSPGVSRGKYDEVL